MVKEPPRRNKDGLCLLHPPPPFYEGTLADFEPTLDNCWFGRVVLLCRFRVKTDMKDGRGRSVLMDCDCALIDCLYDYAPGR